MTTIREPRSLYYPGYPTLSKHRPTLLVSWWCTGFSLVIILVRCFGRLIRMNRLFPEDKIMAASIAPLMARMALIHVVLLYGTNNMGSEGLTDIKIDDVERLELGSKLVLVARVFYAMFLWTQKLTILQSFKRLTGQFWKKGYEKGLVTIRIFLVATFLAIFVATIGECQPFRHYWQVRPDPGPQCREAYAQLITMGTFNIITDLILVVFPVSIILASQFTTKRKIQLTLLFALSFIPIAATGYRVPKIIQLRGRQQYRTLWASLEILAATGAANAIVIGSFIRDRGPKKSKYKFGSTTASHASLDRTPTQRRRLSQWGSDEDLFGGTGVGLSPDLRKLPDLEARPAPVALPPDEDGRVENAALSFSFRKDDSSSSSTDLKGEQNSGEPAHSPGQESTNSNQKTGFFDVGGLLDTATPRQSNMAPKSTEIYDTAITRDKAVAAGRRGSEALLHDIGGLLTPVSDVPRRPSLTMKPAPAALPPPIHPHRAPSETSKTISTRGRIGSEDTLIEVPAHILARNHRVADVEPSQPSTARSQTLQSLQDAGGLLSTTEQNDYAK